ncbi:MAG: hypothetical protein M1819_006933 [Sarea resinae]|nr:MAG: hypothetical protein M1819_006933 [Sarea resinae]
MAAASDKARFYLEQSVPELQEYQRKKIFGKDEIIAITKKRSDFEHKLNGRGSRPSDYARYAEYEMNLESLRRKRVKRLGIKATTHAGQRRIFFILDRATRKFHGDVGLWMQYIEFARKEKANKKLSQILTSVLRMHPTKPELWIYAAKYAIESTADMTAARSYMQRGLRFCKSSKLLWLEYAKLEMIYIAKISARRQILGLDEKRPRSNDKTVLDDPNADLIALPAITAEDVDPSLRGDDELDQAALQNLSTAPALTGAIPLAIFDAGMKHFEMSDELGDNFFDMFTQFEGLPCLSTILQHVVDCLLMNTPESPLSLGCFIRQPVIGIEAKSPEFPSALGKSIERLRLSLRKAKPKLRLVEGVAAWIAGLSSIEGLDPAIQKVLFVTLRQAVRNIEEVDVEDQRVELGHFTLLLRTLHEAGMKDDAQIVQQMGRNRWGFEERIQGAVDHNG